MRGPAELMPQEGAALTGAFDNIHPGLSQDDAIRLLSAPLAELGVLLPSPPPALSAPASYTYSPYLKLFYPGGDGTGP